MTAWSSQSLTRSRSGIQCLTVALLDSYMPAQPNPLVFLLIGLDRGQPPRLSCIVLESSRCILARQELGQQGLPLLGVSWTLRGVPSRRCGWAMTRMLLVRAHHTKQQASSWAAMPWSGMSPYLGSVMGRIAFSIEGHCRPTCLPSCGLVENRLSSSPGIWARHPCRPMRARICNPLKSSDTLQRAALPGSGASEVCGC